MGPSAATKKSSGRVTFMTPTDESPLIRKSLLDVTGRSDCKIEDDIPRKILTNFILMAVLFSACHGTVVSCLDLASARLGNLGAWQSGTLYLTYTGSAVLGATYVVKRLGPRNAMMVAMIIYCVYIGCFLVATLVPRVENTAAILGAAIGGIGAGFLWTAQGSYFAQASEKYATTSDITNHSATSFLGGVFAFIYLTEEVSLKLLSSAMIQWGYSWGNVFTVYFVVAVLSCFFMQFVHEYEELQEEREENFMHKVNASLRLLIKDPKMKFMIGLNATFALTSAFLISYVSGTVEPIAMSDDKSVYIGILFSITSAVAAIMSIVFAYLAQKTGKGIILSIGALSFFFVGYMFIWFDNVAQDWNWSLLVILFSLQGIGRATFESTLRATFADMFPFEKEGAFANIILQNGCISALIFFLSELITPFAFEVMIMISSIGAIWGYWRAFVIFKFEQDILPIGDRTNY